MAKIFTNIPAPFMPKKWFKQTEIIKVLFETQKAQDSNLIIQKTNDFYESVNQDHSIKEWNTIRIEKAMSHFTTALNSHEDAIETVASEVNYLAEEFYKNDFKYLDLIDPEERTEKPKKVIHTEQGGEESYQKKDTSSLYVNPSYGNPFPGNEPETMKIVRYTTTALNHAAFDQMQHYCGSLKHRKIRPLDKNEIPETQAPASENLLGVTSKVSTTIYNLFMIMGIVAETTLYHFLMSNKVGMEQTESILASLGALAVFSFCGFGLYKYVRPYLVTKDKTPFLFFVTITLAAVMVVGMALLNQISISQEKLQDELIIMQADKQTLNEDLVQATENNETKSEIAALKNEMLALKNEIKEKKAEIKSKKIRADWISFVTIGITGLTILLSVCLIKAALILMKRASHYRSKRDKAKKKYMELRKTHAAMVKQHDRARDLMSVIVFHICRKHIIENNIAMNPKTSEYRQAVQQQYHNGHSVAKSSINTNSLNHNSHAYNN